MSGLGLTDYGSGLHGEGRGSLNALSGLDSGANFDYGDTLELAESKADYDAETILSKGSIQSDQKRNGSLSDTSSTNQNFDFTDRSIRQLSGNGPHLYTLDQTNQNLLGLLQFPVVTLPFSFMGNLQLPFFDPSPYVPYLLPAPEKRPYNQQDFSSWPSLQDSLKAGTPSRDQEENLGNFVQEFLTVTHQVAMTKEHAARVKGIIESELTIGDKKTTLSTMMKELNKILGINGYLKGDLLAPAFVFDSAESPTITLGTIELAYAIDSKQMHEAIEHVKKYFEVTLENGKTHTYLFKVSDKNQKITHFRINLYDKIHEQIEIGPFCDLRIFNDSIYTFTEYNVKREYVKNVNTHLKDIRSANFSLNDSLKDLSNILSQSYVSLLQGGVVRFSKNQKRWRHSNLIDYWLTTTKSHQIIKMLQKHISSLPSNTAVMIDFFNWISTMHNEKQFRPFIEAWLQAAIKCDIGDEFISFVQDLAKHPELVEDLKNIIYGMLMVSAGRNISPFIFPWMEEVINRKKIKPFINYGFSISLNGTTHHLFMSFRHSPVSLAMTFADSCSSFSKSLNDVSMKYPPQFARTFSRRFSNMLKSLGVSENLMPENVALFSSEWRQLIFKRGVEFVQGRTFEVLLDHYNKTTCLKLLKDIQKWCFDPEISIKELFSELYNFNLNLLLNKLELAEKDSASLKQILHGKLGEIETIILSKLQQENQATRLSLINVFKKRSDLEVSGKYLTDIFPNVAEAITRCKTLNPQKKEIRSLIEFFEKQDNEKIAPHLDELLEVIDSLLLHTKQHELIKETIAFYLSLFKKFPHIINNRSITESIIASSELLINDTEVNANNNFKSELSKLIYQAIKNGKACNPQSFSLLLLSNNIKHIELAQNYLETIRENGELFSKLSVQYIKQTVSLENLDRNKCILFLSLKDSVDNTCVNIVAGAACRLIIKNNNNRQLGHQVLEKVFSKYKLTQYSTIFNYLTDYVSSRKDLSTYELENLSFIFSRFYEIDKNAFKKLAKNKKPAIIKNLAIRLIEITKIKTDRAEDLNKQGFSLLDKLAENFPKEQLGNLILCSIAKILSKKSQTLIDGVYCAVIPVSALQKFENLKKYLNAKDVNFFNQFKIDKTKNRIQLLSSFFKEFHERFKDDLDIQPLQKRLELESKDQELNEVDTTQNYDNIFNDALSIKKRKQLIINTFRKRSEELKKDTHTVCKLLTLVDSWLNSDDSLEKVLAARAIFSVGVKETIFKDDPEKRSLAVFKKVSFNISAIGSQSVQLRYRLNQMLRSNAVAQQMNNPHWRSISETAFKTIQNLLINKELDAPNERFAAITMLFELVIKNEKTLSGMNDSDLQKYSSRVKELTIQIVQAAIAEKQVDTIRKYQEDLLSIFEKSAEVDKLAITSFDLIMELNKGSRKAAVDLEKEAAQLSKEIGQSKEFFKLFKRVELLIQQCSLYNEDKLFLIATELFTSLINSLPSNVNYSIPGMDDCFISFNNYLKLKQKTFEEVNFYETQLKMIKSIESLLKVLAAKVNPFVKKRVEKLLLTVLLLDQKSTDNKNNTPQISNLELLVFNILEKTSFSKNGKIETILSFLTRVVEKYSNGTQKTFFGRCQKLVTYIQKNIQEKELYEAYEKNHSLLTLEELSLVIYSKLGLNDVAIDCFIKTVDKFQKIPTANRSKELARRINYLIYLLKSLPSFIEKRNQRLATTTTTTNSVNSSRDENLMISLNSVLRNLFNMLKEETITNVNIGDLFHELTLTFSNEKFIDDKVWRLIVEFLILLSSVKNQSSYCKKVLNIYFEKALNKYFAFYKGDLSSENVTKQIVDNLLNQKKVVKTLKHLRPEIREDRLESSKKKISDTLTAFHRQRDLVPFDLSLIETFPLICSFNKEKAKELLLQIFNSIDVGAEDSNFLKLIDQFCTVYPQESLEILNFYMSEFISKLHSSEKIVEKQAAAAVRLMINIFVIYKKSMSEEAFNKQFLSLIDNVWFKYFEKNSIFKNNREIHFFAKALAKQLPPNLISPALAKIFVESILEKLFLFSRLMVYLEPKDIIYKINQANEVTERMKQELKILISSAQCWFKVPSQEGFDFLLKQIRSLPKDFFHPTNKGAFLLNNPFDISPNTINTTLELLKIYTLAYKPTDNDAVARLKEMKSFFKSLYELIAFAGDANNLRDAGIRIAHLRFYELIKTEILDHFFNQDDKERASVIVKLFDN